jgi:hypothetical protein
MGADRLAPSRFRLLASFVAGRSIEIAQGLAGEAAHTNGHVIFVSAGSPIEMQRREVLVQSALLGAGSLHDHLVKSLRGRPSVARRYLAVEGHRVLAELAPRMPLAAALLLERAPIVATAVESLELARGRTKLAEPPAWFGVIKPSQLRSATPGPRARAAGSELRLRLDLTSVPEPDDDDDTEHSAESKILKLFETPLANSRGLAEFLRKLFGNSRAQGNDAPGGELRVGSTRRSDALGGNSRPLPTRIHFTDDGRPGAAVGVGGALHPEWDVFNGRYRPDWCRVIDFPLTATADVATGDVPRDDVLRRRLARVGLGPKVLRGRADGDELDIEARQSTSIWSAASSRAILVCSSCSTHQDPPPTTIPPALPSTSTSAGRQPYSPRHSKNSAIASPSTHSGRRDGTPSNCRRSRPSGNVSAPSLGRGSPNCSRPTTPAWAPVSAVQAKY